MRHNSEDELLKYALEAVANEEARANIAAHLAVCPECSQRLENLQKDIEIIGGVRPRGRVLQIPRGRPGQAVTHTLLRAAALIILGFLVGLGASNWVNHEPVFVSPAYVTLSPPADHLAAYTVSDATEIPAPYYEQILEPQE